MSIKEDQDDHIPFILEPGVSSKEYRKNWAKLIQKIYNVNLHLYARRACRKIVLFFLSEFPYLVVPLML